MTNLQTAVKNPIAAFLVQDEPFTLDDLSRIKSDGPATWAARQDSLIWDDDPLQWDGLPMLLRSMIVTDTIEALQMPVRYALPFRHLGRVVTFALLPEEVRPIRVRVRQASSPSPSPAQPPQRSASKDPPVPFLAMGLVSPEIVALHAWTIRQFLAGQDEIHFNSNLWRIMVRLGREARITKSEAFYYMLSMRALASKSWQQIREYFGLMTLEYIIDRAVTQHPAQAQILAHAHLVQGRPIEWAGADPLEVELSE